MIPRNIILVTKYFVKIVQNYLLTAFQGSGEDLAYRSKS